MRKVKSHKVCTICKKLLPRSSFYRRSREGQAIKSHCKACNKIAARRTYHNNREHYLAKSSVYRQAHRDELRESYKKYNKNNKGKRLARKHKRRARKADLPGQFSEEDWQCLKELYSNRCLCCGTKDEPLTRDHVVSISSGGSNWLWNIQPLCRSCNSTKGVKDTDYRDYYV